MPINPVHVALMHNGESAHVVSGSGKTTQPIRTCGPRSGTPSRVRSPVQTVALGYVSAIGMVVIPTAGPLWLAARCNTILFFGQPKTAAFDPATNTFTDLQNMAHGRWYPSATTLADGSVMTFSGANETGGGNKAVEIYTVGSDGAGIRRQLDSGLYPCLHLLPERESFLLGITVTSMMFDPTAHTWTTVGNTISSDTRTYGSSVLLPLTPANNYGPQGSHHGWRKSGHQDYGETIDSERLLRLGRKVHRCRRNLSR